MTEQNNTNEPKPVLDDAAAEELDLIVDGDLPTRSQKARRSVAGAALAASMLGVGEIIEPEKTSVDIEQAADAPDEPDDGLLSKFDFGELPPLN